jgi:hypothetical protein
MTKDQDANYKMKSSSIKTDDSEHFPQGGSSNSCHYTALESLKISVELDSGSNVLLA